MLKPTLENLLVFKDTIEDIDKKFWQVVEKERRLFEINNKKKTIEEESDYINKRNSIRRQLEAHNG
jgi:hypothetical protein